MGIYIASNQDDQSITSNFKRTDLGSFKETTCQLFSSMEARMVTEMNSKENEHNRECEALRDQIKEAQMKFFYSNSILHNKNVL